MSTADDRPTGPRLTTTSYAILGLLAVRSSSSYELTRQMGRGLGRIWPRAASKLYEEPKKLAALGLARAREGSVGERRRTVYSITPKGRRTLAAWLAEPGAGPVLESEQLVKLFFADHGTTRDALATIAAARAWAEERNEDNVRVGRAYLAGEGEFQERVATNMVVGAFLTELYRTVAEWADWAEQVVGRWPEDPRGATLDREAMEWVVDRAGWSVR